jgi:hypothetical protein
LTKARPRVAGQGTGELRRAGEPANVVTVAIARELAAFARAIAIAVMPPRIELEGSLPQNIQHSLMVIRRY